MTLKLEPTVPGPRDPPLDRGRLMTGQQVADEIFRGTVSAAWVRRNVPYKITLGHSTVRWCENDVRAWIETLRNGDAA